MLIDIIVTYFLILTKPVAHIPVDLRSRFPPVFDQGNTHSCVAQSIASVIMYHKNTDISDIRDDGKSYKKIPFPSRSDLYFQARIDKSKDEGADFLAAMNVLRYSSLCDEGDWKFNDRPRNLLREVPPAKCLINRKVYDDFRPFHLPRNSLAVNYAIRQHLPVVIGLRLPRFFFNKSVYERGRLDRVPDILTVEDSEILSVHAMVAVATNENDAVVLRNSWTRRWGDNGYVVVPSLFLDTYLVDAWTLRPLH